MTQEQRHVRMQSLQDELKNLCAIRDGQIRLQDRIATVLDDLRAVTNDFGAVMRGEARSR